MVITANTTIQLKGPMLDGSGDRALNTAIDLAARRLMDDALQEVEQETTVFKAPTGVYKSLLHIVVSPPWFRVVPGRLPYVAWLEGTSRRNQTTRFKGYHLFRNARRRVESYAGQRFESYLRPHLARLR
jgi:hypothetical protein